MKKPEQFPEWQRLTLLAVASLIVVLSLFSMYTAAMNWTSLPSNLIVVLYFFVTLIVVPVLAAWAFALAWQEREPRLALTLTAVPAAILLLRAIFIGGL
jgi:hypothetical protein